MLYLSLLSKGALLNTLKQKFFIAFDHLLNFIDSYPNTPHTKLV